MHVLKCFRIVLFACLFSLPAVRDVEAFQNDWLSMEVVEGSGYEVEFPKQPLKQTNDVESELGPISMTMLIAGVDDSNALIASLNSFPTLNLWNAWESYGQYSVEDGLEGAVQGAAENSGSKIVKKDAIEKSGLAGRECLLQHPAGLVMRARFYVDGRNLKLYQAIVVAPNEKTAYGADADRFLDSMSFPSGVPAVDSWEEYELGDGKLGVKFPSEPISLNQKAETDVGPINIHLHQLDISDSYAFVSSFTEYPATAEYDVDAGLVGAVNGAAESGQGTIESVKDISKNGVKGKEAYFAGQQGFVMRARFYISHKAGKPAIYSAVVVASDKSTLENETTNAFLDSMNF